MTALRCPECGEPLELGHDCLAETPREPDPWPIIEWLAENMPRALELCPYKVNGIGTAEKPDVRGEFLKLLKDGAKGPRRVVERESVAERDNEAEALDYPVLVPSGGKLAGYWMLAPGVFTPPCGFSVEPPFECMLPYRHEGPHYMSDTSERADHAS